MKNNELPMKEILAGLNLMIELKLKEEMTDENRAILIDAGEDLKEIAVYPWKPEEIDDLNARLTAVNEKLQKTKES